MIPIQKITGRLGNQMFQFAYIYSKMLDREIPDVYVQNINYFEKHQDKIKSLFSEGIGYLDYVSIHVRRGSNPINLDEPKYSENPFYVNLSETDYYERSIEMFPGDKFLVFSDDVEYCKEKWGNDERFQIMDKGAEIEDFNLMASCKSQIIANSSYSWWAGFLNPNPTKIVIAPKQWFKDGVERVKFPKTWRLI